MRRAREDFLTLLCAQQKVNTKRHPNFLRMELTQKIVTLDSPLQAISLRFRGDLSKVNYIEAYNKLGQEMTRQGVSYEKSSYFCVYPSDPSVYAGTSTDPTAECLVDVCITLPEGAPMVAQGEFGITHIASGTYLVMNMVGPYSQMAEAYSQMYGKLLPEAYKTYQPDPLRPMMERYANDPEQVSANELITEFWHAIK